MNQRTLTHKEPGKRTTNKINLDLINAQLHLGQSMDETTTLDSGRLTFDNSALTSSGLRNVSEVKYICSPLKMREKMRQHIALIPQTQYNLITQEMENKNCQVLITDDDKRGRNSAFRTSYRKLLESDGQFNRTKGIFAFEMDKRDILFKCLRTNDK